MIAILKSLNFIQNIYGNNSIILLKLNLNNETDMINPSVDGLIINTNDYFNHQS